MGELSRILGINLKAPFNIFQNKKENYKERPGQYVRGIVYDFNK